jgi:hypothetical protein
MRPPGYRAWQYLLMADGILRRSCWLRTLSGAPRCGREFRRSAGAGRHRFYRWWLVLLLAVPVFLVLLKLITPVLRAGGVVPDR